jgi:branched-chain amino acid transport system ATP-binding protein
MALLEGNNLSKYFGGLPALDRVDFHIEKGEILGLIGPNGAGKTTLVNILTGVYPVSSGTASFDGKNFTNHKSHRVVQMGIARTFQIAQPFPGMTVRENVAIGSIFGREGHLRDMKAAFTEADRWIEFVRLDRYRNAEVNEINISYRKRMDLAKTLAMGPELLMLDEVMAGLNTKDIEEMMALIQTINTDLEKTLLVIEHVMKAVMGISHRVMVLHHGEKIAEDTPQRIVKNERVIQAYLGSRYVRERDDVVRG